MSDPRPLYRIKPLVWNREGSNFWVAGMYTVWLRQRDKAWCWSASGGKVAVASTANTAKAAAEAHYQSGLLSALDPVTEDTK